jgi:hypothetical protein
LKRRISLGSEARPVPRQSFGVSLPSTGGQSRVAADGAGEATGARAKPPAAPKNGGGEA